MSKFNASKQFEPEKHSQKCKANGCPLVWVKDGLCTVHSNQPASRWTGITTRIIESRQTYDAYVRVLHMGPGAFDNNRNMFEHFSIPPNENENGLSYHARLLADFRKRVTDF